MSKAGLAVFGAIAITALPWEGAFGTYEIKGRWEVPSTTTRLSTSGSNPIFQDAYLRAMRRWGSQTFQLVPDMTDALPCTKPQHPYNKVTNATWIGTTDSYCKTPWKLGEYAWTLLWQRPDPDPHKQYIVKADIVFNGFHYATDWSVYDTRWMDPEFNGRLDFTRVAVHELGHLMGLGHSDTPADIMYPHPTDVIRPSPTDLLMLANNYRPLPPPPPEDAFKCTVVPWWPAFDMGEFANRSTVGCLDRHNSLSSVTFRLGGAAAIRLVLASDRAETHVSLSSSSGQSYWHEAGTGKLRKQFDGTLPAGAYRVQLWRTQGTGSQFSLISERQ